MNPSPVGVEHNLSGLACAAGTPGARAFLPCHRRMRLGLLCANLLCADSGEEREDNSLSIHDDESEMFKFLMVVGRRFSPGKEGGFYR